MTATPPESRPPAPGPAQAAAPFLSRAARWLTFASAVSILFSIAASQILLALALAALMLSGDKLRCRPSSCRWPYSLGAPFWRWPFPATPPRDCRKSASSTSFASCWWSTRRYATCG